MTTTSAHGFLKGGHRVVSRNKLEVPAHTLRQSEFLDLLYVATTDAAHSLVAALLPCVEAAESRTRPRGPKERAKVLDALSAVLGGVLVPGLTKGRIVHRGMAQSAFDGLVGYRPAKLVLDALTTQGLLTRFPGIHFVQQRDGTADVSSGMVSRFVSTVALYELADAHGVNETTAPLAFARAYPTRPPKVAQLLTLKAIESRRGRAPVRGGGGGVSIPIRSGDPQARLLRDEVKLANRAYDGASWLGCQPPRAYRAFRENWELGGRWVVAGSQTVQTMAPDARLRITVNGQPVTEIDARASQLTILAGLAGVAQLPDDPYQLDGYSRRAVKQAVLVTIGNGRLTTKWSRRSLDDNPELAEVDMKALSAALSVAYPFLREPGALLGVNPNRTALRLQAIEADILTSVMVPLWRERVPVVSLHDGILCPADQTDRVRVALGAAYRERANGVAVRLTVDGAL